MTLNNNMYTIFGRFRFSNNARTKCDIQLNRYTIEAHVNCELRSHWSREPVYNILNLNKMLSVIKSVTNFEFRYPNSEYNMEWKSNRYAIICVE